MHLVIWGGTEGEAVTGEVLTKRNCLELEKSQLGLNCSFPRIACILEKLQRLGKAGMDASFQGFLSSRAGTSDMDFMKPNLCEKEEAHLGSAAVLCLKSLLLSSCLLLTNREIVNYAGVQVFCFL